ncbi:hypothetical protein ABIC28_002639 [Rhodococcus sp. PvR044]|jgi:hypothetical protein|uniref:hypothetical protein n=1 Tax=unclassified Rhodococcus (in: high G+C Gram-positive bacteria) TaxID=192944 RepID=UPI000BD17890|nr:MULTISPECIES: hypothetical protein [unclassified Rhodococcus (in: high G+C Gram-positive bacteria)]MBP1162128.1 hypothetical protein [Rhodococcus sp. PvR099]PTR43164.1 hypothetical protein C8K38_10835 [Rhodococcus sp. OK611]SNX91028.1 hypothetical protein SAMN05447004_10834 [Rhodococcus sp. OK270]
MNRYQSAAIGLYLTATIAQALTWSDLSGDERSTRIALFLLAGSLLAAILGAAARPKD